MMDAVVTFDAGRAVLHDYLEGYPARLTVGTQQPLREALASERLSQDTRLLTFEFDGVLYAIPMSIVLSYNVVQGRIGTQDWLMTFCNACNTGMVLDPLVGNQVRHFQRRGSYDGLLLIWDEESESFWQHITGQCLHGPSQGEQMRQITVTRPMTTAEALAHSVPAWLFVGELTPEQQQLSYMMEKMRAKPERVERGILETIAAEDTRRPRFELGVGVWTEQESYFFPLVLLHAHDSVYLMQLGGRTLLIFHQPGAIAPVAAYVDARRAQWEREVLRLDGGRYIQDDLLYMADGNPQPLERPMQLLMRWYGFALTFPGCKVAA
jgi:hypothetical protein